MTVSDGGEQLPLLELGGGGSGALLTSDKWREAASTGLLQRFAGFHPSTPYVFVISKTTPSTQPGAGEKRDGEERGTFVAPCGVPEGTSEAL